MADGEARISISEERLRLVLSEMEANNKLALLEMEQRLRIYFDEQLKHTADKSDFLEVARKLDALDRGDFTAVHERALDDFIEKHIAREQAAGWSRREKLFAYIAIVLTLLSVGTGMYTAFHSASQAAGLNQETP